MKIIVFVDVGDTEYRRIKSMFLPYNTVFVDSRRNSLEDEYKNLQNVISNNRKISTEMILGRYSGRSEIAEEIGDENEDLIIFMSANKSNPCYVEDRENVIKKFLENIK
ncbi:MAG: hypothetical protein KBH94_03065 [Caldisericia bacterium]|jgi:hypothetical protein|nr:hypothetical protein [Caldisericia bacterium]